jgi:putative polymerase
MIKAHKTAIIVLTFTGVTYNAWLALINAHIATLSPALTVVSELAIIGLLAAVVYLDGFKQQDKTALALIGLAFVSLVINYVASGIILLDSVRNALIIGLFFMAGLRCDKPTLLTAFKWCTVCVLGVLLLEIISLEHYVKLFQPAIYFAQVKGLTVQEFNDVGVFGAALGYQSRFSFGLFSGPRTSSLFLEQVALGNFATIALLYAFLVKTSQRYITFMAAACALLIILSSNSRFGFGMALLMLLITIFPFKKPPFSNSLAIVTILGAGLIYSSMIEINEFDSLKGRLHHGFKSLQHMDILEYFGFATHKIANFGDAGLAYTIINFGLIGTIVLFSMILNSINQRSQHYILAAILIALYFVLSLVISGTSVYSMKTAPLLWLLLGYITAESYHIATQSRVHPDHGVNLNHAQP